MVLAPATLLQLAPAVLVFLLCIPPGQLFYGPVNCETCNSDFSAKISMKAMISIPLYTTAAGQTIVKVVSIPDTAMVNMKCLNSRNRSNAETNIQVLEILWHWRQPILSSAIVPVPSATEREYETSSLNIKDGKTDEMKTTGQPTVHNTKLVKHDAKSTKSGVTFWSAVSIYPSAESATTTKSREGRKGDDITQNNYKTKSTEATPNQDGGSTLVIDDSSIPNIVANESLPTEKQESYVYHQNNDVSTNEPTVAYVDTANITGSTTEMSSTGTTFDHFTSEHFLKESPGYVTSDIPTTIELVSTPEGLNNTDVFSTTETFTISSLRFDFSTETASPETTSADSESSEQTLLSTTENPNESEATFTTESWTEGTQQSELEGYNVIRSTTAENEEHPYTESLGTTHDDSITTSGYSTTDYSSTDINGEGTSTVTEMSELTTITKSSENSLSDKLLTEGTTPVDESTMYTISLFNTPASVETTSIGELWSTDDARGATASYLPFAEITSENPSTLTNSGTDGLQTSKTDSSTLTTGAPVETITTQPDTSVEITTFLDAGKRENFQESTSRDTTDETLTTSNDRTTTRKESLLFYPRLKREIEMLNRLVFYFNGSSATSYLFEIHLEVQLEPSIIPEIRKRIFYSRHASGLRRFEAPRERSYTCSSSELISFGTSEFSLNLSDIMISVFMRNNCTYQKEWVCGTSSLLDLNPSINNNDLANTLTLVIGSLLVFIVVVGIIFHVVKRHCKFNVSSEEDITKEPPSSQPGNLAP